MFFISDGLFRTDLGLACVFVRGTDSKALRPIAHTQKRECAESTRTRSLHQFTRSAELVEGLIVGFVSVWNEACLQLQSAAVSFAPDK